MWVAVGCDSWSAGVAMGLADSDDEMGMGVGGARYLLAPHRVTGVHTAVLHTDSNRLPASKFRSACGASRG